MMRHLRVLIYVCAIAAGVLIHTSGFAQGSPLIQAPITTGACATWASSYKITSTSGACNTGTVTSITAGVGLTGGVISSTGTVALDLTRVFTSGATGLVPASGGGTVKYLRADGTWQTAITAINFGNGLLGGMVTTTGAISIDPSFLFTNISSGLVPASGGGAANFLRADGTWVAPAGTGVSSFTAGTTGLTPSSPTTGAIVLGGVLVTANGGTNCAAASGTCLDNITGFSATGFMRRTGAGTYTFTAPTGTGSVVLATSPALTEPLTTPSSVSGLTACVSGLDGARSFVTDSTVVAAANFGAAVAGTGANHVPVYCDGGTATWRIG